MPSNVFEGVFNEYRERYQPLISVEEAAEIAHVPRATIHSWSSAGLLDEFKVRRGRRVLFSRDAFVEFMVSSNEARQ